MSRGLQRVETRLTLNKGTQLIRIGGNLLILGLDDIALIFVYGVLIIAILGNDSKGIEQGP